MLKSSSAGKLNKTPLNAEKKTYLQRYVLLLNPELQEDRKWKDNVVCRINEALRKATSTAVRAAVADARETLADRHDALFNQRQIGCRYVFSAFNGVLFSFPAP
jgi:hypothetical protein